MTQIVDLQQLFAEVRHVGLRKGDLDRVQVLERTKAHGRKHEPADSVVVMADIKKERATGHGSFFLYMV